ncbi:MAG: SAM-dependent chlorinase/fluorinase [Chloroflexi bacterium]|nr:SAM-dependent chlorinase/fluorinase [Chloroflexota bacterium]
MARSIRPLISLLTDFGTRDPFVGVMKGVILGINPDVLLVDLTHGIPPQNVAAGAFALATSHAYLPAGSIHLAVVDPGVGSDRRGIAIQTARATFVGPDNGLFSLALAELAPEEYRAVALLEAKYWLPEVSATFHGRDIFAPVAACLSLGLPLEQLGPAVSDLVRLPVSTPRTLPDGIIVGHVLHVDRFGNAITNVRGSQVAFRALIAVGGAQIDELSRSYADGAELLALIGSTGYLEIAVKNGSAAERLGLTVGSEVLVSPRRP